MRPLAVMGDVGEQGGAVPPSTVGTGPAQAGVGTPQQPTYAAQEAPVGVPSEVGYRIRFLTNFRFFFSPFFSKIVVNPIPWRKLK